MSSELGVAAQRVDALAREALRARIPEPEVRRDRAQCVISLEAMAEADRGGDPLRVLANGYERQDFRMWGHRTTDWFARWFAAVNALVPLMAFGMFTILNSTTR